MTRRRVSGRHEAGLLAYVHAVLMVSAVVLGIWLALRTGGDPDWSIVPPLLVLCIGFWLLGRWLRR